MFNLFLVRDLVKFDAIPIFSFMITVIMPVMVPLVYILGAVCNLEFSYNIDQTVNTIILNITVF